MTHIRKEFIDLADILSVLRRQARLISLTVVVVLAVAFVYLARVTPLYTATALVMVDPVGKNLLDPSQTTAVSSNTENARMESEVEILKSDNLALATIQQTELYLTDEFGVSLSLFEKIKQVLGMAPAAVPSGDYLLYSTLNGFAEALTVHRRGLTYLVALSFTSESPELAAKIANAHAETFIQNELDAKVSDVLAGRDILQMQVDQARQQLTLSDGVLAAYIESNLDRLIEESGNDRVLALRETLSGVNSARLATLDAQGRSRVALASGDFSTLAATVGDAALTRLQQQRETLQRQLDGVEIGSPEAIDLAAGLDAIEQQMNDVGATAVSNLEARVQALETRDDELRQTMRSEILGSSLSPQTLTEIYGLQQDAQIAQQQYDRVLFRLRELETQALVQVSDTRIVSRALTPQRPSFPNKKLVLSLALAVGLGGGLGLALLYEFFVAGVTSSAQLSHLVPQRVAAVVPRVEMAEDTVTVADKIVDEPMSLLAEAFRRMRASIDRQVPDQSGKGKVIMVTSSVPAEGKSTDALALARTYAGAGKRTLLIDADLRNPSLHKFIGIEPTHGILEYLLGDPETDDRGEFYDADPKSPLGVIMGRRRSTVPTDAPLQSVKMTDLITNARNALDIIIIDTPPLVPVVDARYIATYVDLALLCVRSGVTKQADLKSAYEQLHESVGPEAKIMTVLNVHEGQEKSYRYTGYYGYCEA